MDENYGIFKTIQDGTDEVANVLQDKTGKDSRNVSQVQKHWIY